MASPLATGGETRGGCETSVFPPSWRHAAWDGPKRPRFPLSAISTAIGGTSVEVSAGSIAQVQRNATGEARTRLLGVLSPEGADGIDMNARNGLLWGGLQHIEERVFARL